jgi:hypothetical protein
VAAVEAKWTLPVHPSFDVIKVPGDRFTEIVEFLRQALGELNPQQSSRPVDPTGAERLAIYSSGQIGIAVAAAGGDRETYIQVGP